MAVKRVTPDDIKVFNDLYFKLHTYAAVARETGFSSSTVAKYIDKNYKPIDETKIKHFSRDMLPEFNDDKFKGVENYGDLCVMSNEEYEEIKELWEELSV